MAQFRGLRDAAQEIANLPDPRGAARPLFPDPNLDWSTELFPYHRGIGRPPENRFHAKYSILRLRRTMQGLEDGQSLLGGEVQPDGTSEVWVPWSIDDSKLLRSALLPISFRVLPRWFSQDWHVAAHPLIPAGERHWYRPDGTFAFSRDGQATGVVESFRRSEHGDWWTLAVNYSDWPAWTPKAVQDAVPWVLIKRITEDDPCFGKILEANSELVARLLGQEQFIDGTGRAAEGKRRVMIMRSAQDDEPWDVPETFPAWEEQVDGMTTGVWIAVDSL